MLSRPQEQRQKTEIPLEIYEREGKHKLSYDTKYWNCVIFGFFLLTLGIIGLFLEQTEAISPLFIGFSIGYLGSVFNSRRENGNKKSGKRG